MSYELINRITIKRDGVYISSHSNNDDHPYYSHRIDSLSKVYAEEGQKGLDREIVRILHESGQLRGTHESLAPYYYTMESPKGRKIYEKYIGMINERFNSLSKDVQDDVRGLKDTKEANEFRQYEQEIRKRMYSEIAELCEEYRQSHKGRSILKEERDI